MCRMDIALLAANIVKARICESMACPGGGEAAVSERIFGDDGWSKHFK